MEFSNVSRTNYCFEKSIKYDARKTNRDAGSSQADTGRRDKTQTRNKETKTGRLLMSATIQTIKDAVTAWELEDSKFEGGNNAAGTRARKALAELGKLIKARRNEITATKNARKESKAA